MNDKKKIRNAFRTAVFERDANRCVMCGKPAVDAHHIQDRTLIINGGYVVENGISLCSDCHLKAEQFHSTGTACPGYSPDDLYIKIKSSLELATRKAEEL